MCTSDIDQTPNRYGTTALTYLLVAVFCALFGAVYEVFSHQVYSFYMIYAFAFPLVLGTLPFLLLNLSKTPPALGALPRSLYHYGIATLTVGSLVCGVLEIYGTTHFLTPLYWIAGLTLLAAALLLQLLKKESRR